jgi:6-phosphofructokinase 1
MTTDRDALEFVSIEGLLAYAESLASLSRVEGAELPPAPSPSTDRERRTHEAMALITAFVQRTQSGFPDAQAYDSARQAIITEGCRGDEVVFYAAWNKLLAEGALTPLYRAPIGADPWRWCPASSLHHNWSRDG